MVAEGGDDEHVTPNRRDGRRSLAERKPRRRVLPLAQLVLASRLLGGDRAIANFGGGNTSAKGIAVDHAGRELNVMWVKGSGSDLATIAERDFTRLRLDEILPLFARAG